MIPKPFIALAALISFPILKGLPFNPGLKLQTPNKDVQEVPLFFKCPKGFSRSYGHE
jgi:hypothetical protein